MTRSDAATPLGREAEVVASAGAATDRRRLLQNVRRIVLFFVILLLLGMLLESAVGIASIGHSRTTFSAASDGFLGYYRLAEELGFDVVRHQRSYGDLPTPRDSVLLVIDPLGAEVLTDERGLHLGSAQIRRLRDFVEQGGHVLATMSGQIQLDIFGRTLVIGRDHDFQFDDGENAIDLLLKDVELSRVFTTWGKAHGQVSADETLGSFQGEWPVPAEGVEQVLSPFLTGSGGMASMKVFEDGHGSDFEPLARLNDLPVVLTCELGLGRIWLVSSPYPFSNVGLGLLDTGPFATELLRAVSDGGWRSVYFDEYCHGLTEGHGLWWWLTSTVLFYPTMAFLVLVGLLAWRYSFRLGPPRQDQGIARRAREEYVVSLAEISRRAGRHRAAGRSILAAYRGRIRTESGMRGAAWLDQSEIAELEPFAKQIDSDGPFSADELREFTTRVEQIYHEHRQGLGGATRDTTSLDNNG